MGSPRLCDPPARPTGWASDDAAEWLQGCLSWRSICRRRSRRADVHPYSLVMFATHFSSAIAWAAGVRALLRNPARYP